jgi:pimeloyl-ACP methyl ester carboxylesterase
MTAPFTGSRWCEASFPRVSAAKGLTRAPRACRVAGNARPPSLSADTVGAFDRASSRAPRRGRPAHREQRARSASETLDEYCAVSQQPGVARSGELLHRSSIAHDIPALLVGRNRRKRLQVPTLLLTGELDPVFTPRMLQGMSPSSALLRRSHQQGIGSPRNVRKKLPPPHGPSLLSIRPIAERHEALILSVS